MRLPFKSLILMMSVAMMTTTTNGQSVPAGVGQNNIVWLEANDLTGPLADGFTWADKTSNNFDAIEINDGTNTPTLVTLGGQQYLRFAGLASEQLIIADDNGTTNLLDNSNEFTVVTVFNTGATDTRAVISKRLNPGNRSWTMFYNTGFEMYGYAGGTTVGGTGSVAAAGNPYITTMTVDASLSGGSVKMFVNSDAEGSTGSNVAIPDRSEDVYIGLFNNGDTRYFNGDIAEIIVYRDALNGGERLILENYLSQKYGVSITSDFFGTDADYVSAYDDDIRGIGTENGTQKQAVSGFSSGLAINELNSSLDASNEFLIFSHNSAVAHADNNTSNLGEIEITNRWLKDYYVELNQNGTIDAASVSAEFVFDFSEAGLPFSGSATDYVLLFRDSTTGDFSRVFANSYSIQNGDQIVIDVPSGRLSTGYYTLGRGTQLISRTWYLLQNGNWIDPSTWTLDAGVLPIPNNPLNEIPGNEDNVVVRSGKTLTIQSTTNNLQLGSIVVDGIMQVGTSSGHDFNIIDGTGKIIIEGNGGVSNFPLGSTISANGFADEVNGGLLVIEGNGLEFNQNASFKDVRIETGNATDIVSIGENLLLTGDLTVRFGTLQFGDGTTNNRELTVLGDVTIENNGSTQDGRIVTANANARHEFNLYGDFINEGSADFTQRVAPNYGSEATDGIVDVNFLDSSDNQLISVQGPTNFYRIEINKGTDATYIADLQSNDPANFNLLGPANDNLDNDIVSTDILNANANALGLISGTLKIGVNVDIPVLNQSGNYCIGANGRLWIDGGTVTKNVATAIVPYGTLEVTAGSLTATGNSGITVRINGLLKVSGGTVTTNNFRTSVQGTQSLGGFQQSGGTVLIDGTLGAGNASGDYYIMSLTYTGNVFIMSGGTLTVRQPNALGAIFINSDPGNISITGGQVIMETSNANVFRVTSRAPFYNVTMRSDASGNGSIRLEGGTSGNGGSAVTLPGQDLRVINDLIIEGYNDSRNNNPLGNFETNFEAITSAANNNDVYVGGSMHVGRNSSYIAVFGGTPNYDGLANQPTDVNTTYFYETGATSAIDSIYYGVTSGIGQLELGNFYLDRTSGYELRTIARGGTSGSIRFDINGDVNIQSGTLDQNAFTFRTWGNIINLDRLGTYYASGPYPTASGTPDVAQIRFREQPPLAFTTSDNSVFGNIRFNVGAATTVEFNTDVRIERVEYWNGRIYVKDNTLTIDEIWNWNNSNSNFFGGSLNTSFLDVNNLGFSGNICVYTDGLSSDGGLKLRITENTSAEDSTSIVNNRSPISFPVGFTPDGGTTVYYRPIQLKVNNFSDTGYVRIRPVSGELNTTELSGGELLRHFWRIDQSDFTTSPTVMYRAYFRNRSDGDIVDLEVGNSQLANYVPGVVQDFGSYLRSYESDASAQEDNGGVFASPDDANTYVIIFNGNNTGTTDDDLFEFGVNSPGFTIENANITAGQSPRFVGAPQVFYSRNRNSGLENWTDGNNWSIDAVNQHLGGVAGDYPQSGDIAIIGYGSIPNGSFLTCNPCTQQSATQRHDIRINGGEVIDVAEIIFNSNPVATAFTNNNSRLRVNQTATLNAGKVSGHGTVFEIVNGGSLATITGDFGDFNSKGKNGWFFWNQNPTSDVVINNRFDFPTFRLFGGNAPFTTAFSADMRAINLVVDRGGILSIDNNITIDSIIRIGLNQEGRIVFPDVGQNNTLSCDSLTLQTNNGNVIDVENTGSDVHTLRVTGNIFLNRLSTFDLTGATNVILELTGEGNHTFLNSTAVIPDLYQIKLNKGVDTSSTFRFRNTVNLEDPAISGIQSLEVLNGLLILDDPAIDFTITDNSTGDFYLPNTNDLRASSGSGGIELRQGILRIEGDDTGMILDGILRIYGGDFDMASGVGNGNNFIEYTSSGKSEIDLTNGSLSVGSQVRRNLTSTTGLLKYSQSNGTFRVGINAAPEDRRGVFEIVNTGSSFSHTGGSFTLVRQNGSSTVASLIIQPDPADVNISGTTITIGDASTPANQNSIGINATVPLNNLLVTGNSGLTVKTYVNDLEINDLTIQNNGNFDANGFNLTLVNDFDNDGTYISSGSSSNNQTTFFTATITQQINGTGSTSLWNLNKTGTGSLSINKDILVENELNLLDGIISSGSNSLDVKGDVINDGIMQSAFAGPGLIFSGTELQNLSRSGIGTSTFGTVTINNQSGVDVPLTGRDFRIDNKVILTNGQFNIGASLLYMENGAFFENGAGGTARGDFSTANMVTVNTSIVDKGIRKTFSDAYSGTFLFPVGLSFYTPVEVEVDNITAGTANTGFITVKPINGVTAGIVEDDDETCPDVATTDFVDEDNVLQYYWLIKSSNITDFDGAISLFHNDAFESIGAIAAPDYSLANYSPARLLENTNAWDKNYSEALFDEVNNRIDFKVNPTTNFTNLTSADIEGRYTAGITRDNSDNQLCGGAIPDVVPLYITVGTATIGDVDDITSYAVAPGGTVPSLGESPDLIVSGDFTLNLTNQFWRFRRVEIQTDATLTVIGSGVNLGTVVGDGTIKLIDNSNFPAGDYDAFFPDATCSGGGGVEYEINSGSEIVLSGILNVREVVLSGNGDKVMGLGQQTNICENLEIRDNGIFRLDDNVRVNVKGDLIKEPTAGFDGDYSNAFMNFDGSSRQEIDGSFTGIEAFANLVVSNPADLTIVNTANDDIEISNQLIMTNGRIFTNASNSMTLLNNSSLIGLFNNSTHVDGPFQRELQASTSAFEFPVGDNGEYLPIEIDDPSYSSGGPTKIWSAEYLWTNPTASPLIANVNDSMNFSTYNGEIGNANSVISGRHMWVVDVNSPATSQVRINWNDRTNVGTSVADWQLLRIMSWDDIDEEWESFGNGNSVADYLGFTSSSGAVISDRLFNYSTRYITWASINTPIAAPNALPVDLLYLQGEKLNEANRISWATASEKNSSHYVIERSSDLEEFDEIGTIDAAMESSNLINYEFFDFDYKVGANYYRLKMVDLNDQVTYSKVVLIENYNSNNEELKISLYPNPVSNKILNYVISENLNSSQVNIEIIDLLGNTIYSETVSSFDLQDRTNTLYLPQSLKSGLYLFNTSIGDQKIQKKFIVLD